MLRKECLMETIKVDDEVFGLLQKHAKPFIDTPNSTLRRLLGLGSTASTDSAARSALSNTDDLDHLLAESLEAAHVRSKAPKADLETLITNGFVRNGEKLYLVDYQGNRVQQFRAVVSGGYLTYNGKRYSMSNLAKELLTKVGFKSGAVRGPAHWVNEQGKSIMKLWQQYQDQKAGK